MVVIGGIMHDACINKTLSINQSFWSFWIWIQENIHILRYAILFVIQVLHFMFSKKILANSKSAQTSGVFRLSAKFLTSEWIDSKIQESTLFFPQFSGVTESILLYGSTPSLVRHAKRYKTKMSNLSHSEGTEKSVNIIIWDIFYTL